LPSTTDSSEKPRDDLEILEAAADEPSPLDAAAVALEQRLQQEMDHRKEERFWWLCGTGLLANVVLAKALNSVPITFLLIFLQVPVLIRFAIRCGVDDVAVLWQYILSKLPKPKDLE
jgi:hypothetical protein